MGSAPSLLSLISVLVIGKGPKDRFGSFLTIVPLSHKGESAAARVGTFPKRWTRMPQFVRAIHRASNARVCLRWRAGIQSSPVAIQRDKGCVTQLQCVYP